MTAAATRFTVRVFQPEPIIEPGGGSSNWLFTGTIYAVDGEPKTETMERLRREARKAHPDSPLIVVEGWADPDLDALAVHDEPVATIEDRP